MSFIIDLKLAKLRGITILSPFKISKTKRKLI